MINAFRSTCRLRLLTQTAVAAIIAAAPTPLLALPTGSSVGAGTASVSTAGGTMTVTVGSPTAIINWGSFSIAGGETVNFTGGAPFTILNRDLGGSPSTIAGTLSGSGVGNIWLLNPNGVTLTGTGRVQNVTGLVLGTLGVADADFLDGNSSFNLTGTATTGVSVLSGGQIASAGPVALIAGTVSNAGTLTAAGDVALVAASDVTIAFNAGSPLSMTISQGTPVDGGIVAGGTIGGRNVYMATISRAGVVNALLNVTGAVSATGATATDRGVVLTAGTSASGIAVNSGGGSDVGGGTGVAASGTITSAKDVEIRAAQNVTGTGTITATGGLNATSGGNITVTGLVSSQNANVSLSAGGNVSFTAAGDVTAPSGDIDLTAGGDITGVSGSTQLTGQNILLTAGDFGGGILSNAALQEANNVSITDTAGGSTISALTALSAANGLTITTTGGGGLNVGGISAPGFITLVSAGTLELTDAINGGSGLVTAIAGGPSSLAAGTISQTGGVITAGLLTGSAGAGSSATLNQANVITSLGGFTANGFSLTDAGGLAVTGAVNGGAGGVSLSTTGDLTIGAALASTNGPISLTAAGASSDIMLNAAVNAGTGSVTLNATGTGGTITQGAAGVLTAGTLTGASNAATTLTAATNRITNLGAFTANGFGLTDADGLAATGAVNGGVGGIALQTSGTLTVNAGLSTANGPIGLTATGAGSDIALAANLGAGTGAVTLTAADAVAQSTGAITAASISGSSGGAFDLGAVAPNNDVAQLGAITAGGTVSYRDINGFTVASPLASSGNVTLIAESGTLGLAADLNGQTVSLNASSGALTQTAGIITADTLTGFVSLAATLDGNNQITNLGGLTANSLSLTDLGGLTVTGSTGPGLGAGDLSVRTTGGALTIAATGAVAGGNVALSTDGTFVNQSGADAVTASGKWAIYSADPTLNSFDNLDSGNTAVFNGTLATRPLSGLTGNRYVFAVQPAITFTSTDATKTYGDALVLSNQFTVTNPVAGVANAFLGDANAFTGVPSLTSAGAAAGATVAGGPYAITLGSGTLSSTSGYSFVFNNSGRLTITPKALTATATANNKTYDGTAAATGSLALSGVVGSDTVTASGAFAFADKNVGTGKAVVVTGATLAGADVGNYTLTLPASAAADIIAKALTATASANDKVYDGTTAATGSITLSGVVTGDAVATSGTTFAFANKNAGTGKAVTVAGTTLSGADAGNYVLTAPASTTASITPKALTATATANTKTYDGTTAATGSVSLAGVVTGDVVATSGGSFAFADRNAGIGKTVDVSGVALSGADAGNYSVTVPATTVADILRRALAVSADGKTKVAGSADPALTFTITSGSLVTGDSLSGALSRTAGERPGQYAIQQGTLAASANYTLTFTPGQLTITPAEGGTPVSDMPTTDNLLDVTSFIRLQQQNTPAVGDGADLVDTERAFECAESDERCQAIQ